VLCWHVTKAVNKPHDAWPVLPHTGPARGCRHVMYHASGAACGQVVVPALTRRRYKGYKGLRA
jgi:hypothetical protein